MVGAKIGVIETMRKEKRKSEVTLSTSLKSQPDVGSRSKPKKKVAVAHWGQAQLTPPRGYDVRSKHNDDDDNEDSKGKTDKAALAAQKKARKAGRGMAGRTRAHKAKEGSERSKQRPSLVKKVKSALSMSRFKKGKTELSREEQRKQNVHTFGSLGVGFAVIMTALILG